jgi:hypothetical protein
MSLTRLTTGLGLLGALTLSLGTDHNNVDAGRPLRFDDASSIAFGERAIEWGVGGNLGRGRNNSAEGALEFKYGFAKNQDFGIAWHPQYAGASQRFTAGELEFSHFRQLQREIDSSPALAYRMKIGVPMDRGEPGVELGLRGILSTTLRQYDKIHFNVDLSYLTEPDAGERDLTWGLLVGYSNPLGAPTQFDKTLVAQFGLEQSRRAGEGWFSTLGIGLRQQIAEQAVFDLGLESEIWKDAASKPSGLRITLGYSVGF